MALTATDLITASPLPQANDFLLYPWLLPGRFTLMVGPTDCGKTTLTLEIVAQCLRGEHLWDRFPCKKIERVVYFHGEHTLETLQEAAKSRGDIPEGAVHVVHDFGSLGSRLIEGGNINIPLIHAMKAVIAEHQPQLIIAEPVSAFLGTSENDNFEVRQVINILAHLGAYANAAVLGHHHVGKAHFDPEREKPVGLPAGEARGAMAFEDASERVIYLRRKISKGAQYLQLESPKIKGFPVSPVTLSFDEDTLTYSYVTQPLAERDIIAVYNRRRRYPNETIRDMIDYFRSVWQTGASPNKVHLILKRAIKVGLIHDLHEKDLQPIPCP